MQKFRRLLIPSMLAVLSLIVSQAVMANMGAEEEPAGPTLEVAALESRQQGEGNLRGVRDRLQRQPATLPLISQTSAELGQGCRHDPCR